MLRDAGHVAYLAGGCVRDMLLGIEPKDFDVATDAPPTRVRELFKKTQAVGQAFGVILVRTRISVIEVATFRSDGDYTDGRHPESVRFATAEEDARRRDFTINGLYFDPIEGSVIDFVGGRDDLEKRLLRAIGNAEARFAEDHLRMLRAVRFAARFDLTIEPATAEAVRRDAHLLPRISGERIADELRDMLVADTRKRAFTELWSLGLIGFTLGIHEPIPTLNVERSLVMALPVKGSAKQISFPVALFCAMVDLRWQASGLTHDILGNLTPPEVSKIVSLARHTLKLSNEESDEMHAIAKLSHTLLNTRDHPVAMLKRTVAHPHYLSMRQLLSAIHTTGVARERIEVIDSRLDALADIDCAPMPFLTGANLIEAGFQPGPAFKSVLEQVYDAQLENRIDCHEEAMALATKLLT